MATFGVVSLDTVASTIDLWVQEVCYWVYLSSPKFLQGGRGGMLISPKAALLKSYKTCFANME